MGRLKYHLLINVLPTLLLLGAMAWGMLLVNQVLVK